MASDKIDEMGGELASKLNELLQNIMQASPDAAKKLKETLVDGLLQPRANKPVSSGSKDKNQAFSVNLRTIHARNVMMVYDMVDKLQKNEIVGEVDVWDGVSALDFLPEESEWGFKPGDSVEIGVTAGLFKSLQKRALAWKKTLSNVYGQPGIVTGVRSKYENAVEVYFPNIYTSTTIYAGVLVKTEGKGISAVPSRWKVGQYVKTRKNNDIVTRFQKRLPDIPNEAVGKKGRVIAVTNVGVFVTFDERSSYAVHPALLVFVEDQSPIPASLPIGHPKGFQIGEKVKVIKHMKKLIENQVEYGGWNWKMSSLFGRMVTITDIQKDGSLNVKLNNDRSWRLNYESAYAAQDVHPLISENDLPFLPGDKVRVRPMENMKMHLHEAKVLESIVEFLKNTAAVVGIDHELDVIVRFNSDHLHLNPYILRKATAQEERKFIDLEVKRSGFDKESQVRLDIGPSTYVRDILSKSRVESDLADLLTEFSTLLHFIDEDHALIAYKNGRQFRVNRKYLTPAEKISAMVKRKPTLEFLGILQMKLETCVRALHHEQNDEYGDSNVDLYSVQSGSPPTVCFTIPATVEKPKRLLESLQSLTECEVEYLREDEGLVSLSAGCTDKVHLVLKGQSEDGGGMSVEDSSGVSDEEACKNETKQVVEGSTDEPNTSIPFVTGGSSQLGSRQNIQLRDLSDLKFLPFNAPGGTVYLAYVTAQERPQAEPATAHSIPVGSASGVQNNFSSPGEGGSIIVNQYYN